MKDLKNYINNIDNLSVRKLYGGTDEQSSIMDAEYWIWDAYEGGLINIETYWFLTAPISEILSTDPNTYHYVSPITGEIWSLDPIGAFYDSQSKTYDQALSIADKTGVLVDGQGKRVTVTQLSALDTNLDGVLSVSEASGLKLLADMNENGCLEAGELNAVTGAIASAGYLGDIHNKLNFR